MWFKRAKKTTIRVDNRKKALLIGCNYLHSPGKTLNGCIQDVEWMADTLVGSYGFNPRNVIVLRDDSHNPKLLPTKANIYAAMKWLTSGASAGSSLVFHFSGHGIRMQSRDGDTLGPASTALLPMDYKVAGVIRAERLNLYLVNPVPYNVQLFSIIDACHSASMLALPYNCRRSALRLSWKDSYAALPSQWKGSAGGLVVQISASEDSQKAIDTARLNGRAQGAATYAFITALQQAKFKITWGRLLVEMHKILDAGDRFGFRPTTGKYGEIATKMAYAAGYKGQTPVISANTMFDLDSKFNLDVTV